MSNAVAESILNAIRRRDFDALTALVEQTDSAANPALAPWCQFARAYLSYEAHQRPADAIPVLEDLRHRRSVLPPTLVGHVFNALGIAYELNEQWDRALRSYQEGLVWHERHQHLDQLPIILLNLTILHRKGGEAEQATGCATRAIALLEQESESSSQQVILAALHNELGLVYRDNGDWSHASQAFAQALADWQTQADEWGQGIAYDNLADIETHLGNTGEAERLYGCGRALSQRAGNHFQAAQATYSLAHLKLATYAPLSEVQPLLDQALQEAQNTHNQEIITHIYLDRATLSERQNDPDQALLETRRAVLTVESLRANIVLPEDRARMAASRNAAYDSLVARLLKSTSAPSKPKAAQLEDAFQVIELAKSRVLTEMLAGQTTAIRHSANLPDSWLVEEQQLRHRLSQHYRDADTDPATLVPLERHLAEVRERIRVADADFAALQTAQPLALAAVQAQLSPDSVLIEYFTLNDAYAALVITAHSATLHLLPLRPAELQRAFGQVEATTLGQLRHLTPDHHGRLHTPWILQKLHKALIAPLGDAVARANQIYIVPHGLLHYVPFHACYNNAASMPNLSDLPDFRIGTIAQPRRVIYSPSATLLVEYCQHKPPSPNRAGLAFGFNGAHLQHAESEADAIAAITHGTAFTGQHATRDTLIAQAGQARYLHLACHGWFNPHWPNASGVLLADATLDVTDILREVRLDADLVSLTACETGLSRIMRGDELIGLTRAFLYAGTPSVLVSQWRVDDLSTRLFGELFYQRLQTQSVAAALQHTQSTLMTLSHDELMGRLQQMGLSVHEAERYVAGLSALYGADRPPHYPFAHPYFWAPFFVVGARAQT